MPIRPHFRHGARALALSAAFLALGAQAFTITSVTPQGEVAQVRQLVAKFSENAVNFGDPKAPPPLKLSCEPENKSDPRAIRVEEGLKSFSRSSPASAQTGLSPKSS